MKKGMKILAVSAIVISTVILLLVNFGDRFTVAGLHMDEIVWRPREENTDPVSVTGRENGEKESEKKPSLQNMISEFSYVVEPVTGNYAFSQLTEEEQKGYQEICNSLLSCEKTAKVSVRDTEQLDKLFDCVMMDHPEIFYVDGYQYTEYSLGKDAAEISFEGNYIYSKSEIKDRIGKIDEVVKEMAASAPNTVDEYELVKYAYDTIIEHTVYDLKAEDNQNICSVFLNGKSVCQGYAKAFQYLLSKLGVVSATVCGEVKGGERHAFNLVRMNGSWYYVDTTWGDACFMLTGEEQENGSHINYDYLGVTTEQLLQTHILNSPVEMPECTATKDNYYIREHAYFYSYNRKAMEELIRRAYESGQETVTIKCDSDMVFEEVRAHLIVKKDIFKLINRPAGTVTYTSNPKQRSMTFWL